MTKRQKKARGNYEPGEVESGVEEIAVMASADNLASCLDVCYEVAEMVQAALREYIKGKKGQERIRKAQKIHDARMEGEDV